MAGTITIGKESRAIKNIKNLLGEILAKEGKIFLLNAVQDLECAKTNSNPYEFLMFNGIQELLSSIPNRKHKELVYASSYLQERDYYNLYVFSRKIGCDFMYSRNLGVSYEQLLYENVFGTKGMMKRWSKKYHTIAIYMWYFLYTFNPGQL